MKDEASLKHVFGLINKETLARGEMCSLAGFNVSQIQSETVIIYDEARHDSCQRWNSHFKPWQNTSYWS